MNIPSWFSDSLKSYDRNLRCRWSHEKKSFVIEAKCHKAGLPLPVKFTVDPLTNTEKEVILPELSDKRIGWRDGYYQIFYFSQFSPEILKYIHSNDVSKIKRLRLNDEISDREIADAAKKEREIDGKMLDISNDAYEMMKVRSGDKLYLSSKRTCDSNWE